VQTVIFSIILLCILGMISSLTTKTLHRIILWFAPINSMPSKPHTRYAQEILTQTVSATIAICFVLIYATPDKQSASWVFTYFTDGSGWGSKIFSFFLGFLSVAWTMTDYDGTTQ